MSYKTQSSCLSRKGICYPDPNSSNLLKVLHCRSFKPTTTNFLLHLKHTYLLNLTEIVTYLPTTSKPQYECHKLGIHLAKTWYGVTHLVVLHRRFVVRSSRLWEDYDRQGNSESIRLQVHQPSGLDADGYVVRGVTEADRRCLLTGRQNPALHYFY